MRRRNDRFETDDSACLINIESVSTGWEGAMVVGGSRGLGQAMTFALSGAGADVCIVGRNLDNLKKTVSAVLNLGQKVEIITADVTHEFEVEKMVSRTIKHFGRIDILVNSQGTVHLQARF